MPVYLVGQLTRYLYMQMTYTDISRIESVCLSLGRRQDYDNRMDLWKQGQLMGA